ncbi:LacI family transcriptional regulator [Mesorhizobium sp. BR1-1-16]|uniref:LacI family DNA-binding transcriptional regulator n=1 Tax=Mesorhizobium sp. BR1-1-16 TaxID=2876653 RepID=UPI001CCD92BE|nr:LacI family transcriptional regulator [Mesorhizobium sp. BR1-1-16]
MERVTLGAIAAQMGLSKFAVSRALSGKSGVSDETRRRVQEVAAELGYTRAETIAKVMTLGLVFHDTDLINSELHLLVQNGVQIEAQKRGYQVRICWTHLPDEVEAFIRGCDGAALVGPHDRTTYTRIYSLGVPIVRTGWLEPLEQVDFVGGTDHESGSAVAEYLARLGHTTIAYVHGTPGYRGRIERYFGFREVLEGLPQIKFLQMKFNDEIRFTEHLRAVHAEGLYPTAFFCAHDGLAVTAISELLRLGYRIPEDASVVGFGDYSAATQISPQLTTVRVHGQQIGAACVRMLDDRIHDRIPRDLPLRVHVASRLINRASAGPAAQTSREKKPDLEPTV